jgi:uncharacterized protein (TIGR02996 family)
MTEDDWKAAVMAQPEDQTIWHVIADWLEERDQPLRAELVRLSRIRVGENPQRVIELLDAGVEPVIPVWTNTLGMKFACVQAGMFLMGSSVTEEGHDDNETQHEVTLTQPFYLGVYPVTVAEFEEFVKATGYKTEAEAVSGGWGFLADEWQMDEGLTWRTPGFAQQGRHPVVRVSWNDAQALVKWLNEVKPDSGLVYSLPSEAQWEYACRAGSQAAFHWGDDEPRLEEFAWFSGNSQNKTWSVETKRANAWGLWHMHGMVWEWCEDFFAEYPENAVQNPTGPLSAGARRVMRGGSWRNDPRYCRSAERHGSDPANRSANRGFRLAVRVKETEQP